MNIGEANDFFALVRGIAVDAGDDARHRALDASARLAERGRKALDAGPTDDQVRNTLDRVMCVLVYGDDADLELMGPRRGVETHEPLGGVL